MQGAPGNGNSHSQSLGTLHGVPSARYLLEMALFSKCQALLGSLRIWALRYGLARNSAEAEFIARTILSEITARAIQGKSRNFSSSTNLLCVAT